MNEPERYPPPDFSCPPPSSFQTPHEQQLPRASSFHPSMWSWGETPSEPSWSYWVSPNWNHGQAAGYNFQTGRGNYGQTHPHYQNVGQEWYQGGRPGGRQNFRPPHQNGKKQKNKKEPEYSNFCDTCDRGFKNQQSYDEHVSQHVKCSVSDCNFMAHEKLVSIHWKNNHAPGAKRIKLDTLEEISKWREERRKNYPTLQNIEKKKKVMEVRQQSGGVLETAEFGRMRGRGRGRGRGWGKRGFRGRHPQGPPIESGSSESPKPPIHPPRGEDPLGVLVHGDHDSDKEDPAPESRSVLVVPPKQMSSALGSLMANYGSMSEEDEEPEAVPIQRARDLVEENKTILNRIHPNSGYTGPSRGLETSTETDQAPTSYSGPNMVKNGRGHHGRGRRYQDTPQKRRPTLLEMLLAPDIRHERNVLLQCVRYVVHNNFFGLESERKDQQAEDMSSTRTVHDDPSPEDGPENISCVVQSACPAGGVAPESGELQSEGTRQEESLISSSVSDPHLDSEGISDAAAAGLVQNAEEMNATSDENMSASNMYDDEIWESNQAAL